MPSTAAAQTDAASEMVRVKYSDDGHKTNRQRSGIAFVFCHMSLIRISLKNCALSTVANANESS